MRRYLDQRGKRRLACGIMASVAIVAATTSPLALALAKNGVRSCGLYENTAVYATRNVSCASAVRVISRAEGPHGFHGNERKIHIYG